MENQKELDERYMRRCLQLAANGRYTTKPNPMVGAVIVCDNRIIGEGYHIRCGEAHAEVNAFASVRPEDESLLKDATIYVSLEPCAHFGKTPPCCDLIIRKGVKRCVVGCVDPFAKVQGRGLQRIREAGIAVTVGVLEQECQNLNRFFFTYHQHHRPYILLKWAQTANGFLDDHGQALAISSPFTKMLVHQLRSQYDAIVVGRVTDEREHPLLNVREWSGPSPCRYVLSHDYSIDQLLNDCYERQQQSLIVEGGRQTLQSFIDRGLWDEIRIETAPLMTEEGTNAPLLPTDVSLEKEEQYGDRVIRRYRKNG
ncbi:MAG: bifunctional diaminohydroxyphosphoribosylaminopyrimidine deaminase/5-amino-6-(5-phosphoribosylamino)uracil reductase RibD [Prevotella sp.]|nr:bifunctional diaminohydroxyphosphoribosylaminopyrimidine deaminase/5-amino-6-(5-phosphoribosylamino)uracil reductase RibD [Prevotella sp.]